MVVYSIIVVNRYGAKRPTYKCFANRDSAIKYCEESNKDTYQYLQSCANNHKDPGNYDLLVFWEIEVEE